VEIEEGIAVFLKLALAAFRRGWPRLASALLEVDLHLSGLGRASPRRIRKEQASRRKQPRADLSMEWEVR
jgi:hypothetical protein